MTAEAQVSSDSTCSECAGPMIESKGPDRIKFYRGHECLIPGHITFPTCRRCGAEWLTSSQIDALSDALEAQLP